MSYTITVDLASARKAAGISLSKASRTLGVSETSVKSMERSKSPQLTTIARYADMCGVHPSSLFTIVEATPEVGEEEEVA